MPLTDDQTIPADKVREILDEWERIKEYADWDDLDTLVKDIRDLLPPPPRPTLADMTPDERAGCKRMQADVEGYENRVVIIQHYWKDGSARVMWPSSHTQTVPWNKTTPRPDLPRLEWPDNEKPAPAPALPDGWRLADHVTHGRVIVTNSTPDSEGDVFFVAPDPDPTGYDWHLCFPDRLTYIDQEADQ